jgi:hypothetical protein
MFRIAASLVFSVICIQAQAGIMWSFESNLISGHFYTEGNTHQTGGSIGGQVLGLEVYESYLDGYAFTSSWQFSGNISGLYGDAADDLCIDQGICPNGQNPDYLIYNYNVSLTSSVLLPISGDLFYELDADVLMIMSTFGGYSTGQVLGHSATECINIVNIYLDSQGSIPEDFRNCGVPSVTPYNHGVTGGYVEISYVKDVNLAKVVSEPPMWWFLALAPIAFGLRKRLAS